MFIRNRAGMETVEMVMLVMAVGVLAIAIAGKLFLTSDNGSNFITNGISNESLPVFGGNGSNP